MPPQDPTAELLAALNKALQEGRITPEEYGKRAKLVSIAKAQREEDRRRCKEVFDKFDADHSGSLDANEFATLVATLGGNMTKAEIDAAFKSLDSDGGGTVDFEEFFSWWSTPEVHGAKPTKLSTLRLTVTTQHLKEQSASAARRLNEALAANSAKRGDDDVQSINLQVSVGDFTTGSGIKVSYENNEAAAAELAKEFGATENDVVISLALAAQPGKDAFELGQLSGKVKDMLAMQEEIKFKAVKNDVKTIGETVVFRINVVVDGSEKIIAETVSTITENLVKSASISLELNEKIGSPFAKELQARLNASLKLAVGGGATVMGLLKVGGGGGRGRKSLKRSLGRKDEPALISVLTSRLREATVKIKTDTVQEALGLVVGTPAPFNNLHQVKPLIASLLAELPWDEMPDTVLDSYKLATENLLGLHSLTVSANKAVLRLEGSNVDFIKLLPDAAAMKAAKDAEEGSDAEPAGGDTEPVEGDGKGPRWLFAPQHGAAAGSEPGYAALAKDTTSRELLFNPGFKFVADEASAAKEVLEIVSSRESGMVQCTVPLPKGAEVGKLYQVAVRIKAAKTATIDSESRIEVVHVAFSDERKAHLAELKLPTDGAWWDVPIGKPFKWEEAEQTTFQCSLHTGDELINGIKIDGFFAYELDPSVVATAATPKSETVAADVQRPLCKGGHPMVWARLPRGGWYCDGCSASHPAAVFHWQCRPCDADFCPACYDKSGKKGDNHSDGSASE